MKASTHFWFDTRHESLVIEDLSAFVFGSRLNFTASRKDGKSQIQVECATDSSKPVDDAIVSRVDYYLNGYVKALARMTHHVKALIVIDERELVHQ